MKFHFASDWGDTLFLALILQKEGHSVTFQTLEKDAKLVGKGLVNFALGPSTGAIVIFDTTGKGKLGDQYRKAGHKVIGGNPYDKELEEDRTSGAEIMRKAGIRIPETETFDSIDEAIGYLEAEKGKGGYFFKPNGHGIDTALTHSSDSSAELVRFLKWAKTKLDSTVKSFEIQKEVKGIEVSTNGWFDGDKFITPFDGTIEDKKLLTGELGPRTGCQSNVVWLWPDRSLLPAITVARITRLLKQHEYCGPIDLNAILLEKDGEPCGLEWTARMGFDATQAWILLLQPKTVGDQLAAFANQELKRWSVKQDQMALTLRVSMPPYPQCGPEAKESQGLPLDPRILRDEQFLPYYVYEGDDGPALAGVDGSVGVVGEVGTDLKEMRKKVLDYAHDLDIPSAQFRTDPVERTEKAFAKMKEWGYMKGIK